MATMMYYPSRNQKKDRRITVLPNNWLGVFRLSDIIWLKETLTPLGASFRFTILRSRCVIDFPSDEALKQFMVAFRMKTASSAS